MDTASMHRSMDPIGVRQDVRRDVADRGFAWIPAAAWSIGPELEPHWRRLVDDWDRLEADRHLEAGATFRRRRYGRYYWSPGTDALIALTHEPYFQPQEENAYAGGVARDFAPLLPDTVRNPFLAALMRCTFACLPVPPDRQRQAWEVRVHQVRIVATREERGEPAPEGIHQDGTDFLTLHLVRRQNIAGAESTIYDLDRKPIASYTMRKPLDSFILEDPRIMHGVTPAYPADGNTTGVRDLLGIDFIFSPALQPPAVVE
jgi:hypothetical protein